MDKDEMLKTPRLWAAFKMIDRDQNGYITYDEVRDVLVTDPAGQDDEIFKEMIREVDEDFDL